MGQRLDEPPETPPRGGAPLRTPAAKRAALAGLAPVLLGLLVLWGVAGLVAARQLAAGHEAAVTETFAGVRALVDAAHEDVRREAALLARDPAVIEGALKGDWAALARGASPRMLALTLERLADLVIVVDATGTTLVQVPATPRVALPALPRPGETVARLAVVADRVWILGVAPLPAGMVVVGRRFESLGRALARQPSRPAVVVLGGDRVLAATQPGLVAARWEATPGGGRVTLRGEPWAARPLVEVGPGLVALVPDGERRGAAWRFWLWWSTPLAAAVVVVGVWAAKRRTPAGRERTAERRGREIEALHAIAEAIGSGDDLAAVAERALEVVCGVAHIDFGGVFRLDEAAQALRLVAHRGLAPADIDRLGTRPLDTSHVGEAARTGRLVVTDLPRSRLLSPEVRERVTAGGYQTQLALPIPVSGRTWGVMALLSREQRTFDGDEIRFLQAVTHQMGAAVGRAVLFAETREKSRRLETLTRLAQTLTATLSLDDVLQRVTDAAVALFDSSVARLWLVDDDGAHVSLRAASGARTSVEGADRFRIGEGLVGTVVTARSPLTLPDVLADPRARNLARIRAEGTVSAALVPVLLADRALGALSIGVRQRHEYTPEEMSVLGSLALHAAGAINNARLFEEERARRGYLGALLDINKKIGSVTETEPLLASIAEEAARLLGVDNAGFRLVDGDDLVLAGLAGLAAQTMLRPRIRIGESMSGQVVATGRSLRCGIGSAPGVIPEHLAADQRLGYTTFLGVPLGIGGRTIGVLTFRARRPFTARDQELAEAFAGQAAIALEQLRLRRETGRQAARMTALADLGRLVSETLDFDRVAQRVADSVCTLLGARSSCLYRVDAESDGLVAVTASADAGEPFPWTRVLPAGTGLAGLAVRDRRPAASADVLADRRIVYTDEVRTKIAGQTHRALVAIPLLVQDRPFGALTVSDEAGRCFTDEEIRLAQAFADQAALALENARLYREAREHAGRLAALEEVNRLVSSSLKMDEVLTNIAAAVARFFDAPYVSVWVLDEANHRLTRALTHGDPETASGLTRELALGEGTVGWVALHREPMLWTDVERDARVLDAGHLTRHGLRFLTAYPVAIGERVLGAFAVHRATPTPVTPESASLLGSLAAQAAVALEHARLYSETQRRLEETRALLEVVELLNSTLDSRQLLKRAAIKIAQVCRVDRCSLELWEGGHVTPLMSQFADGRRSPREWEAFRAVGARPLLDVPANALAGETRRPVVVNDTTDDTLMPREWIDAFGLKSYLVAPMIRQEQVIGVMTLDCCERPIRFQQWQVDLAMTIAGQLALSLENTRLYTEAQERLRETTTLMNVGQILSRPGPTGERMRQVAREVARAFGADMVGAYFLDEQKEGLVPLAGYHVPKELLATFRNRPVVPSRFPDLARLMREGKAVWSPDTRQDARFDQEWVGMLPPHSVLFASAIARGEPIGALFVLWWRPGRQFPPAELRLIESVAAQVGLAMENAELARQTEVKLRETETLLSVSQAMSTTLDLQALLRHFLRRVTRAVDADSAGVWMLGDDGVSLAPVAGYHVPREFVEYLRGFRISLVEHPFCEEAVRTRQPVFSKDVAGDARIPDFAKNPFRHQGELFVPIIAKERVMGGFSLIWWERSHAFSDSERALMEAIANQAGVAIENARLFEENRHQLEELAVLHELSQAVTGQLDRAAVLQAIREQVARVLDARNMVVVLRDEEGAELEVALRVADGVPDMRPPLRYPARAVGLMSVVFETGRAVRTDDYEAECARRGVEAIPASGQLRRWLGVPMIAGDVVVGVLALRGGARGFTEADERLLTNIAHLAALALRSARLFEERTRAYRELAAAQDQLVRTEKLRALGEMASGVAHDFNNLLASILGRAQLALQRVQHPQLRQWLQVIERAALDGARTVRRLQEFTRIRRDQPLVAVDLNEVVRDALEITQSRWREEPVSRGVELEVRTSFAELPRVAGDPAELREAMTNLILNAVDAMPRGGLLTLTTAVANGAVVVTVADTGVGIPETIRDRIFDPFFTTKGPQGTGLGLSMTYGILGRHGARVAVESEEGRGTTFRMTFAPGTPEGEGEAAPGAGAATGSASLRCLVVDDEPAVGAMLGDVLASGGHRVVVVQDGGEAIARFSAEPFDVVFTDLAMPRVSGWQVARAIKEIAPAVPVILVTGFGVELSAEERRTHRVDLVLVKPLKIQEVLDAAAQAARRRAQPTRTEDTR